MSFKAVQAKMAKGGVGMERAGAMLASRTRKTMKAHGLSTAHGIPKNVFQKKGFKKNLPGMSVHPVVNCNEASRKSSMPMASALVGRSDYKTGSKHF